MKTVRVYSCSKQAIRQLNIPALGNAVVEARLLSQSVMREHGRNLVVIDPQTRGVIHIGEAVPSAFITKCRVRGVTPAAVIDVPAVVVPEAPAPEPVMPEPVTPEPQAPVEPDPAPEEPLPAAAEVTENVETEEPVSEPGETEEAKPKKRRGKKAADPQPE